MNKRYVSVTDWLANQQEVESFPLSQLAKGKTSAALLFVCLFPRWLSAENGFIWNDRLSEKRDTDNRALFFEGQTFLTWSIGKESTKWKKRHHMWLCLFSRQQCHMTSPQWWTDKRYCLQKREKKICVNMGHKNTFVENSVADFCLSQHSAALLVCWMEKNKMAEKLRWFWRLQSEK